MLKENIDIVKFGENISTIQKRATFENISVLYEDALTKPKFEVSKNAIEIILLIFEKKINLTEDEKRIYKLLSSTILKPISDIAPYVPFGKSKTTKILQEMEHKGLIKIEGKGRGTKYIIM